MQLKNDLFIVCNQCNKVLMISKDDLEADSTSYERKMGNENEILFHGSFYCDNCPNEISIEITGFEYPTMCFNYSTELCNGGDFLIPPSWSVSEFYMMSEDALSMYLPKVEKQIYNIACKNEYYSKLTPREFEIAVEKIFNSIGFNTVLTPATNDGGKDIIAYAKYNDKPFIIYIECKRYKSTNKVGVSIIRELFGVQQADNINSSIVVTTSDFTKGSHSFANKRKVKINLVNSDILIRLARNYLN